MVYLSKVVLEKNCNNMVITAAFTCPDFTLKKFAQSSWKNDFFFFHLKCRLIKLFSSFSSVVHYLKMKTKSLRNFHWMNKLISLFFILLETELPENRIMSIFRRF